MRRAGQAGVLGRACIELLGGCRPRGHAAKMLNSGHAAQRPCALAPPAAQFTRAPQGLTLACAAAVAATVRQPPCTCHNPNTRIIIIHACRTSRSTSVSGWRRPGRSGDPTPRTPALLCSTFRARPPWTAQPSPCSVSAPLPVLFLSATRQAPAFCSRLGGQSGARGSSITAEPFSVVHMATGLLQPLLPAPPPGQATQRLPGLGSPRHASYDIARAITFMLDLHLTKTARPLPLLQTTL